VRDCRLEFENDGVDYRGALHANMSRNLAWTSALGDAYINQQQELSQAVQTMRDRAKQAGNLNTTPQQKVETKGKTIIIEPAQTDVVYVPQYDPWMAYGAPLAMFPGWYAYPGLYLDGPGIGFGLGLASGSSAASAGVGTTGDSIGITAAGWSTTTTRTSRIAGQS